MNFLYSFLLAAAWLSAGLLCAADISKLEAQLDSPEESVRSNAATALLSLGEEGRNILRRRAAGHNHAALEAITALRGDPSLINDPALREGMKRWLEQSQTVVNPPFPDPASHLTNGGFEKDGGWDVRLEDGAEALIEYAITPIRSGTRSLRFRRINAAGTAYLRSADPVKIPAGETAIARVYFHADNADFVNTLRLRFEDSAGNVTAGDEYSGALRQSQTFAQNTPAGQWIKRVGVLPAQPHEREVWLRLYWDGNPGDIWLDDFTFPSRPYAYAHTAPLRPLPGVGYAGTSDEKPRTASVIRRDDRTVLLRDGKPSVPVLYHTIQADFGDYAQMGQQAGLQWQIVTVPFQQHPIMRQKYPPGFDYWCEDGSFDVNGALRFIGEAASRMPEESTMLLGLYISWPKSWTAKNLDSRWKAEDGTYAMGSLGHLLGFGSELPPDQQWWLSPFHDASMEEVVRGIKLLVEAARKEPWFSRVGGCFIAGGHDGQFYTTPWPDYSEPAVRAFRTWLHQKYQTEERLRTAWHQPDATFSQATIPSFNAALKRSETFFDPTHDQALVDYRACLDERGMRIREIIAEAFKESAGKPVIALTWEMSGAIGYSVESIFLKSKFLDGLAPQPSYALRLPGLSGGIPAPLASFNMNGKLCIKELDLRTWLRSGEKDVDNQRVSAAMTPEAFRAINRKETGPMIAAHQGFWYYDIGNTHFRDPAMLDEIGGVRKIADDVYPKANHFHSQMAVVHCGDAGLWEVPTRSGPSALSLLQNFNTNALNASGVPYDAYFLRDFMKLVDLSHYRLIIFPNAWRLTDAERQWIEQNLKKDGRHLVWCYATDFLSEDKSSREKLIGMRTQMARSGALKAFASVKEMSLDKKRLVGIAEITFRMYEGMITASNLPRFTIDDSNIEEIARYEDGKVAAARRRFADWTSIYFAMPAGLDPTTVNALARDAGAFCASKPGLLVNMNSNFLSVHVLEAGVYDIQLPKSTIARKFFADTHDSESNVLHLTSQPGESLWYQLIPSN